MKRIRLFAIMLLTAAGMACTSESAPESQADQQVNPVAEETAEINPLMSIFEIPATDLPRAVDFYEAILGIHIEQMALPGMEMGIFPYEGQLVTGVIIKGEGYTPSATGVTIYLNGGDNLQPILDKVEAHGGQIIVPKTAHADESGYFALFVDTEGNKLGLHSPN